MSKNKYRAAPGNYFLNDEDAREIGILFEKIFPAGQITADLVLEAAKDRKSPLHKFFEWDDKKAAYLWRKDQARKIIRAIVIDVDGAEVPAYHHVYLEESEDSRYVDQRQARESEELWKQVVSGALKEARAWKARYQTYRQLEPVFTAIDDVEKKMR